MMLRLSSLGDQSHDPVLYNLLLLSVQRGIVSSEFLEHDEELLQRNVFVLVFGDCGENCVCVGEQIVLLVIVAVATKRNGANPGLLGRGRRGGGRTRGRGGCGCSGSSGRGGGLGKRLWCRDPGGLRYRREGRSGEARGSGWRGCLALPQRGRDVLHGTRLEPPPPAHSNNLCI